MHLPSTIKGNKKIILFDGVCNLCSAFLNFVYNRDIKKIYMFAWIQSEKGKEILAWLSLPIEEYETILYIENGKPFYKSTAFLKIVKSLRFPWPVLWLWVVIPKFIRNWFYDLIASNRYRLFGKKDKCVVPTGDLKERFL